LLAVARPYIDMARMSLQHDQQPGALKPLFQALARAVTTDPFGDTMEALFSEVPAVPDPLLLDVRDIADGRYGEGPHGQPGGIDVSLTAARFDPCILEGGAEVAGA
jgi:hypothetical protein